MQTSNVNKICNIRVKSRNFGFIQTWQARNYVGGEEASPTLFWKTKKCPIFEKKRSDCVHLWVEFFIRNVVLIVRFWRNVYRSALVPWNLPCLEKLLALRLLGEKILKSMSQTKEKCNSHVLSRSYPWMEWRCHCIRAFIVIIFVQSQL